MKGTGEISNLAFNSRWELVAKTLVTFSDNKEHGFINQPISFGQALMVEKCL